VEQRPKEPDRVLVLTAAVEEGEDLAGLEHALERQRSSLNVIAKEAHIEFTRARMALERALRETAALSPLGPTTL